MKKRIYTPFVVDEKPFCLWDDDIPQKNLDFLDKIDPEYFNHIANVNIELLNNEQTEKRVRQHAAVSLRTAYSHALEAFFALIGATVQAPDCVIGWLLRYENFDLKNLIKKVNNSEQIHSNFEPTPICWRDVAEIVFSHAEGTDKKVYDFLVENFSNLWTDFANDFVNQNFTDEYNTIKHGLRLRMGGFFFVVDFTNSPVLSGNPQAHANSEFGTNFFKTEKIDKHNFVIHELSRNWNPLNYFYALDLLCTSMKNVISYLKVTNGVDYATLGVSYADDPKYYDKPWENNVGVSDIQKNSSIIINKVPVLPKETIFSRYSANKKA